MYGVFDAPSKLYHDPKYILDRKGFSTKIFIADAAQIYLCCIPYKNQGSKPFTPLMLPLSILK